MQLQLIAVNMINLFGFSTSDEIINIKKLISECSHVMSRKALPQFRDILN